MKGKVVAARPAAVPALRAAASEQPAPVAAVGKDLIAETRRRFFRLLGVAFVVTAVCNSLAMLVPLYSMQLYNIVLNARNTNTLFWLTAGLLFAMAVFGALEFARSNLYEAMAQRAARALALPALLAAARSAEVKAPALSGQAMRDLGEVRSFVSGSAVTVPLDLVWSPFLVVALFLMHWVYGLVAVACATLLMVLGWIGTLMTSDSLQQANDETTQSFAEIAVAIRGAEAVEALGMLPALSRRWRRSQERMLGKLWRGTRTMKAVAAAHKAARLLMTGGMVCTGLILSIKGEASGGSMVASNMMLARLLLPFEQFAVSWRSWIAAADAWRRLSALIGETGSKRGVHPLPCRSGRLHVERLVYIPPGADKPALRGVTFDIEPGQILGVIGPSGAGKSTLARLAVGTAEPTSGGVYLDGNSTWLWERSDFGRHVGYMPQQTVLLDGTVGENIARMADGDPASIMAAAQAAGIHDAIMRLPQGYATALSEAGFVLSGGQRQRVALARALYGEPKLLVLDEPNSSLDADGEKVLLDAVVAAKQRGAAVLMIAHRPSLVAVADRLLVLKDGLIDRFGERERVLQALKAPPVRLVKGPEASARSAAP